MVFCMMIVYDKCINGVVYKIILKIYSKNIMDILEILILFVLIK